MGQVKTVIFDFDGTLANSGELVFNLYNEHAEEFGYKPSEWSEVPKLRRMGYKRAMREKGIKLRHLPRIALVVGREMRKRMGEVQPCEGVVEMLERLKDEGYSIGVLTSNQAALVKEFFKNHNFPDFDFVVSEKTLFGKEKALKRILHRYELSEENVVYVGDEPRDVTASHKADIRVVGVTWGLGGSEMFEKTPPDVMVTTALQLEEAIKSLLN